MITGVVKLNPPVDLNGVSVQVAVLDCSLADAPATRVTAFCYPGVYRDAGEPFQFTLDDERLDPTKYNLLSVHVVLSGDPTAVQPGDYINTQAYPVKPGDAVEVTVHRVA